MPKSPLLGVEEEVIPPQDEDLEDEVSDLDEEDEDEQEEEEAPVEKKTRARAPKEAKAAKVGNLNVGTLGDARIDTSVPMSANGRIYLNALLESPLMPAIVPPDMLNEATEHVFCINSLRVIVPKGKIVQVPMILAQEITQSFSNRV